MNTEFRNLKGNVQVFPCKWKNNNNSYVWTLSIQHWAHQAFNQTESKIHRKLNSYGWITTTSLKYHRNVRRARMCVRIYAIRTIIITRTSSTKEWNRIWCFSAAEYPKKNANQIEWQMVVKVIFDEMNTEWRTSIIYHIKLLTIFLCIGESMTMEPVIKSNFHIEHWTLHTAYTYESTMRHTTSVSIQYNFL